MKKNTIRRNTKRLVQSVIKVPKELIKLQQVVELAIDCFFANKHVLFTTYSTKICFRMVTHIVLHPKEYMWEALHSTYKMYLIKGFRIVVLSGNHEFAALNDLAANLPTAPELNWAATSQHCGLIEQNIHILKKKIHSLCHSSPFEMVPDIIVVHIVLHIVKFVNGFPP
jgi:hypothetical protein